MRTRKFQPGDWKVRVGRSYAGLGLFAVDAIPKGACIIEYFGRTISKAEEYTSNSKYLFKISSKRTIDGTTRKNIARYINHSCKPNAEPKIYAQRVYIMATKNIKPGEEIKYDYGDEYVEEHIAPYGCKCGSCSGKKLPKKSR